MSRSREAWVTAVAAVLGVSPAACHRDSAREDPARAVEVPFSSTSALPSASAPSASAVAAASAAPAASASVSASTAAKPPVPPPIDSSSPFMAKQLQASCGAKSCGGTGCGAMSPKAAPPPQLTTTLSGNVGKDSATMTALRPGLVACATSALNTNPQEHGSVTLGLSIAADGTVSTTTTGTTQGLSTANTSCMASRLRRGAFEATGKARALAATVVVKPSP